MVSLKRWLKAQEYEKSFWQKYAEDIASGVSEKLDWYAWRARELEKKIVQFIDDKWKLSAKILEVGSGPVGIISFLKYGERYAIDPLEEYYSISPVLTEFRDPDVRYIKGLGETLPFEDESFSLIILDNVIDHAFNPWQMLGEIRRVLVSGGLFYIALNVRTYWGSKLHKIVSKISVDKGHPHSFTVESIRVLLNRNDFRIKSEFVENSKDARKKDFCSKELKAKIKGITGLSEFLYQAVCLSP